VPWAKKPLRIAEQAISGAFFALQNVLKMQRNVNNQISYTMYRYTGVNRNHVWFKEAPVKQELVANHFENNS
jgi:hypothetical protein